MKSLFKGSISRFIYEVSPFNFQIILIGLLNLRSLPIDIPSNFRRLLVYFKNYHHLLLHYPLLWIINEFDKDINFLFPSHTQPGFVFSVLLWERCHIKNLHFAFHQRMFSNWVCLVHFRFFLWQREDNSSRCLHQSHHHFVDNYSYYGCRHLENAQALG